MFPAAVITYFAPLAIASCFASSSVICRHHLFDYRGSLSEVLDLHLMDPLDRSQSLIHFVTPFVHRVLYSAFPGGCTMKTYTACVLLVLFVWSARGLMAWEPKGDGVCCFISAAGDDVCTSGVTVDQCRSFWAGVWVPGFTTCFDDEVNCAEWEPFGACCLPNESCQVAYALGCTESGGSFKGAGTDCATVAVCEGDPRPAGCVFDVNVDGVVDVEDLALIIDNWGECEQ